MFWILVLAVLLWWAWRVCFSVFFSPLRHVPSPWVFQVFPMYFYLHLAKGDSPQFLHYYFLKYGPVFRAGWNFVLFVDGEAASDLYSTYKLQKSNDYDIFSAFGPNMLTIKDRTLHSIRRRKVGPIMTKQSIARMEPAIIESALKPLLDNIEGAAASKEPINLYLQCHYFSWDMIGRLSFGESFQMLKNGNHPAVKWLDGVLNHAMVSLAVPFYNRVPSKDAEQLKKFATGVLDRYLARNSTESYDIIGQFLTAKQDSPALTREEVFAEAFLQLFAGTDTTSNTLNWFFYNILTHPQVEAKIIKELKEAGLLNPGRILTLDDITDRLPYFEMALKESMRFLPVVASTPFRIIPKGGRRVLGYHLPEGTKVAIPIYSLHRSPAVWENPDSFIPERWLSAKVGPGDYLPFLMGPRACAGKYLAVAEIHLAVVNLLTNYKFTLADPNEGKITIAMPTLVPKSLKNTVTVTRRT